jgi:hypothetical protein
VRVTARDTDDAFDGGWHRVGDGHVAGSEAQGGVSGEDGDDVYGGDFAVCHGLCCVAV